MCLATPVKIQKIDGEKAIVEGGKTVDISIIAGKVKPGDYILAHADLAINKLEKKDALEIIELAQGCEHSH